MIHIHHRLRNREYPNCVALAAQMSICLRTAKRDVEFMTERMHLPIQYDPRKHGYYYTRPVDKFPTLAITEREVFALMIAHKAVAQYRGTPFEKPLAVAFRKLAGQLSTKTTYSLDNLQEAFSFRPFAPEDTDLDVFDVVSRAFEQERVLRFLYRKLGVKAPAARLVRPYHVACIENHWYLIGFDLDRRALRTFAITRLSKPEMTSKRFKRPKAFRLEDYLSKSLSVYRGRDDYEVVIDFDPWATDLLRGRHWQSKQQFTELPDGWSRMRMRLDGVEEVERWVLTWGLHATVVRPRALAARLRKIGEGLVRKYDNFAGDAPSTS
jgi:proteasome accessory factor B